MDVLKVPACVILNSVSMYFVKLPRLALILLLMSIGDLHLVVELSIWQSSVDAAQDGSDQPSLGRLD